MNELPKNKAIAENFEISHNFCFSPNVKPTIATIQQALKKYSEKLEDEITLQTDTPIFLDTNVLLDYYKISFSERTELINFFKQNVKRFHLTKQVEIEFLKHRVDHIKSYLKSLEEFVNSYRNIKNEIDNLKSGEIKGFQHYIDKNKILINDYQDLHSELKQLNQTLKEKLTNLFQESDLGQQLEEKEQRIEEIKKRLEGDADIERNDPLLDVISEFKVLDELSNDECEFIKKHYESLNEKYEPLKDNQKEFFKHTFPGCGDKKDEPEGDLVIYHEIIKFMKTNQTDAIFLTNDTSKNDWLLRNKTELVPFSHYVINTFINTEKTLYIFQASDKIRLSYSPVYIEDDEISGEGEILKPLNESATNIEGVKVVGKIELKETQSGFKYYDEITESQFIEQLKASELWSQNYGDGFVGLKSFVEKFLGGKGFYFSTSYDIKTKLVEDGTVEEYTYEPKTSFYNPVTAIKLKKSKE